MKEDGANNIIERVTGGRMEVQVEETKQTATHICYQKANKLRYEAQIKIDALNMGIDNTNFELAVANTKKLLGTYAKTLESLSSEIAQQTKEQRESWEPKAKRLQECHTVLNKNLAQALQLCKQRSAKNGKMHKRKDSGEESALKQQLQQQEGLKQAERIALEIQSYGKEVYGSIQDQSVTLNVKSHVCSCWHRESTFELIR